jgi:hypothetical protein
MFDRIGFRVEMVPTEGGGKEGRLVPNTSQEAISRFVQGVFDRFGQPPARDLPEKSGKPAQQRTKAS